jgi:hypothetical protein
MARRVPAERRASKVPILFAFRLVTGNSTIGLRDCVLSVDSTGAAVTLTLPAASAVPPGTPYTAVKVAGGANDVTIARAAGDTIGQQAANLSFSTAQIQAAQLVSDGISNWLVEGISFSSSGSPTRIATVNATILAGTATVTTADLGFGSLAAKRVLVSINQAAFDATATRVQAIGNAGGTVTVNSNVNATADLVVAILVDAR